MKKLSIGSWAFLSDQEQPTNDFHALVHKLQHLGYQGIELGASRRIRPRRAMTARRSGKSCGRWSSIIAWNSRGSRRISRRRNCGAWPSRGRSWRRLRRMWHSRPTWASRSIRVDTVEPMPRVQETGIEPTLLFDRCIKAFDACAKIAARHGVTVAWSFEPALPINTPDRDRCADRSGACFGQHKFRSALRHLRSPSLQRRQCPIALAKPQRQDRPCPPGRHRWHAQRPWPKRARAVWARACSTSIAHPGARCVRRRQRLVVRRSEFRAGRLGGRRRRQAISRQAAAQVRGITARLSEPERLARQSLAWRSGSERDSPCFAKL